MKHCFCLVYLAYRPGNRHMERESKHVLDSGLHAGDFGFQALDSSLCQWNLDFGFQSLWDSDFLSCFRDSKAQDSGCHKQSFPRELRIPRAKNFADSGIKIPFHWPNRRDGKTRYNTTCPVIKCCLENISVKVLC